MSRASVVCPGCGLTAARKNGRDRQDRQIHQCGGCRRRFTARSATPFSGYRFRPDLIALAVRWYVRYRLSDADVAELLAATLPPVAHETGKAVQQRSGRDHQHLKGRLRPLRGFKTLAGARVLCRAQAFLRNLRGGFDDLGRLMDAAAGPQQPPVMPAWAALTGTLLRR